MAATERPALGPALLAAALALPGLSPLAQAESAPVQGHVGLRMLDYQDSQPGAERVRVKAPALTAFVPLGSEWSLAGSWITDSISGASPLYHSKSLTRLHDVRHASDLTLTRYLPQGTWKVGAAYSNESDFLSRSVHAGFTRSDESKNTVWSLQTALTHDRINPVNQVVDNETRETVDVLAGVTQVLTERDIVQLQWGWSQSQGYLSDPYKLLDERPRQRQRQTLQTRWNHHIEDWNATLRGAYRLFRDDWGIRAHTFELEHVQALAGGYKISPSLRYHTQSAAHFYVDADGSRGPFAPSPPAGALYHSLDQRLSAFGAFTVGLKLSYTLDERTVFDVKFEHYEQRSAWAWGGGSPNLLPLRARSVFWGVTHWF